MFQIRSIILAGVALAACASDNTAPTGTPAANAIGVVSGNVQTAPVGSALSAPLVVHVTDQYGNAIAGVAVTFTPSSGATLTSTTATTDASGNAQTSVTFGHLSGVDTVIASVSGVSTPARFILNATAGAATHDTVSGNSQTGSAGTALALPLSVTLTDDFGNPVVGDTVTWTTPSGTLSSTTAVTDATGTARVQFTPAVGPNTVTATVGNSSLVITFTETGM